MSQAHLDKFLTLLSNDPTALKKASKGTQDPDEFLQNVQQYAKENGYEFTEGEVKTLITAQSQKLDGGELNDTQLQGVAGGAGAAPKTAADLMKPLTTGGTRTTGGG